MRLPLLVFLLLSCSASFGADQCAPGAEVCRGIKPEPVPPAKTVKEIIERLDPIEAHFKSRSGDNAPMTPEDKKAAGQLLSYVQMLEEKARNSPKMVDADGDPVDMKDFLRVCANTQDYLNSLTDSNNGEAGVRANFTAFIHSVSHGYTAKLLSEHEAKQAAGDQKDKDKDKPEDRDPNPSDDKNPKTDKKKDPKPEPSGESKDPGLRDILDKMEDQKRETAQRKEKGGKGAEEKRVLEADNYQGKGLGARSGQVLAMARNSSQNINVQNADNLQGNANLRPGMGAFTGRPPSRAELSAQARAPSLAQAMRSAGAPSVGAAVLDATMRQAGVVPGRDDLVKGNGKTLSDAEFKDFLGALEGNQAEYAKLLSLYENRAGSAYEEQFKDIDLTPTKELEWTRTCEKIAIEKCNALARFASLFYKKGQLLKMAEVKLLLDDIDRLSGPSPEHRERMAKLKDLGRAPPPASFPREAYKRLNAAAAELASAGYSIRNNELNHPSLDPETYGGSDWRRDLGARLGELEGGLLSPHDIRWLQSAVRASLDTCLERARRFGAAREDAQADKALSQAEKEAAEFLEAAGKTLAQANEAWVGDWVAKRKDPGRDPEVQAALKKAMQKLEGEGDGEFAAWNKKMAGLLDRLNGKVSDTEAASLLNTLFDSAAQRAALADPVAVGYLRLEQKKFNASAVDIKTRQTMIRAVTGFEPPSGAWQGKEFMTSMAFALKALPFQGLVDASGLGGWAGTALAPYREKQAAQRRDDLLSATAKAEAEWLKSIPGQAGLLKQYEGYGALSPEQRLEWHKRVVAAMDASPTGKTDLDLGRRLAGVQIDTEREASKLRKDPAYQGKYDEAMAVLAKEGETLRAQALGLGQLDKSYADARKAWESYVQGNKEALGDFKDGTRFDPAELGMPPRTGPVTKVSEGFSSGLEFGVVDPETKILKRHFESLDGALTLDQWEEQGKAFGVATDFSHGGYVKRGIGALNFKETGRMGEGGLLIPEERVDKVRLPGKDGDYPVKTRYRNGMILERVEPVLDGQGKVQWLTRLNPALDYGSLSDGSIGREGWSAAKINELTKICLLDSRTIKNFDAQGNPLFSIYIKDKVLTVETAQAVYRMGADPDGSLWRQVYSVRDGRRSENPESMASIERPTREEDYYRVIMKRQDNAGNYELRGERWTLSATRMEVRESTEYVNLYHRDLDPRSWDGFMAGVEGDWLSRGVYAPIGWVGEKVGKVSKIAVHGGGGMAANALGNVMQAAGADVAGAWMSVRGSITEDKAVNTRSNEEIVERALENVMDAKVRRDIEDRLLRDAFDRKWPGLDQREKKILEGEFRDAHRNRKDLLNALAAEIVSEEGVEKAYSELESAGGLGKAAGKSLHFVDSVGQAAAGGQALKLFSVTTTGLGRLAGMSPKGALSLGQAVTMPAGIGMNAEMALDITHKAAEFLSTTKKGMDQAGDLAETGAQLLIFNMVGKIEGAHEQAALEKESAGWKPERLVEELQKARQGGEAGRELALLGKLVESSRASGGSLPPEIHAQYGSTLAEWKAESKKGLLSVSQELERLEKSFGSADDAARLKMSERAGELRAEQSFLERQGELLAETSPPSRDRGLLRGVEEGSELPSAKELDAARQALRRHQWRDQRRAEGGGDETPSAGELEAASLRQRALELRKALDAAGEELPSFSPARDAQGRVVFKDRHTGQEFTPDEIKALQNEPRVNPYYEANQVAPKGSGPAAPTSEGLKRVAELDEIMGAGAQEHNRLRVKEARLIPNDPARQERSNRSYLDSAMEGAGKRKGEVTGEELEGGVSDRTLVPSKKPVEVQTTGNCATQAGVNGLNALPEEYGGLNSEKFNALVDKTIGSHVAEGVREGMGATQALTIYQAVGRELGVGVKIIPAEKLFSTIALDGRGAMIFIDIGGSGHAVFLEGSFTHNGRAYASILDSNVGGRIFMPVEDLAGSMRGSAIAWDPAAPIDAGPQMRKGVRLSKEWDQRRSAEYSEGMERVDQARQERSSRAKQASELEHVLEDPALRRKAFEEQRPNPANFPFDAGFDNEATFTEAMRQKLLDLRQEPQERASPTRPAQDSSNLGAPLSALQPKAYSQVDYIASGSNGDVYRARGPEGDRALKRPSRAPRRAGEGALEDEARLGRAAYEAFGDSSKASETPAPADVGLVKIYEHGLMPLDAFSKKAPAPPAKSGFFDRLFGAKGAEEPAPPKVETLVMEWVDGQPLGKQSKPLSAGEWEDIRSAVTRLHKLGFAHNDISADNLMVVEKDGARRIVLMDYGSMKTRSDGVKFDEAVKRDLERLEHLRTRFAR